MADRLVSFDPAKPAGQRFPEDVREDLAELTGDLSPTVAAAVADQVPPAVDAAVAPAVDAYVEGLEPEIIPDPDSPDTHDRVKIGDAVGPAYERNISATSAVANEIALQFPEAIGRLTPLIWSPDGTADRPENPGPVAIASPVEPESLVDGDFWWDYSGDPPAFLTTELGSMNKGVPTSQFLVMSGTEPITFKLKSGSSLPDGLVLSSAGELHGPPAGAVSYSFIAVAKNGFGEVEWEFTGTIGAAVAPSIVTGSLGTLAVGQWVSVKLVASGSAPVEWEVTDGALPDGLELDGDLISGTVENDDSYAFDLTASNEAGSDTKEFSGSIGAADAPTITTAELGPMTVGVPFTQTLTADGTAPIGWEEIDGELPDGVSLSGDVVSGNPTTAGGYSVEFEASNAGGTDTKVFSGEVDVSNPPLYDAIGNGIIYAQASGAFTTSYTTHNAAEDATVLYFGTFIGTASTAPSLGLMYGGPSGVPMTQVGTTQEVGSSGGYYAYAYVFKLENAPAGSKQVHFTLGAGMVAVIANTISYTGVGSVGSLQAAPMSAPSLAHSNVVSQAGHTVVQAFLYPWAFGGFGSSYNKTSRWNVPSGTNPNRPGVIGEAAGAADVDFTATATAGAIATAIGLAVSLAGV